MLVEGKSDPFSWTLVEFDAIIVVVAKGYHNYNFEENLVCWSVRLFTDSSL